MVLSLTATTYRLQEGVDEKSINTNRLTCMWSVKMKGEGSIKGERGTERKGLKSREKHCNNQEPKL